MIGEDPGLAATTAGIGLCFGAYRWHLSREHAFDDDEHDQAYLETCLARLDAARFGAARPGLADGTARPGA